ncbi:hypothetical protein KKF81_04165 [Candidatus Micrarchaeota archaeon]|nr:hypothetical protein [Candidatus Micrarchaeota archaeon]MBU1166120.1 hypothetical protein [Candidatus Micrarchaeota archaeon]MBU1887043.1 hypothetical protein [Candidatus Micrarchaeota archaeon]
MKDNRQVSIILKDQAQKEFEELTKIVSEQQTKGDINSEEIQLLKSIKQKVEILKTNPIYGIRFPEDKYRKILMSRISFELVLLGIGGCFIL